MVKFKNPKIIHRIYFENFAPYRDPYEHYLESWRREMPDYTIMRWGKDNLDVHANEWTIRAFKQKAPVFLAEYFRWKVLSEYGGIYLDADCEIIDGKVLDAIATELYEQDEYDTFFGVEERSNGFPTAQTVGARPGSGLVQFMCDLYENRLAPMWPWRETRGLIGPQLVSLYYQGDKDVPVEQRDGFFRNLDEPVVTRRTKVYPQTYFSPKFSLMGDTLDYDEGKTCVYHLFANSNIDFAADKRKAEERSRALTFDEYRAELARKAAFPRTYHASHFTPKNGAFSDTGISAKNTSGLIFYGPYFSLGEGSYIATLNCPIISGPGKVIVCVTASSGDNVLARQDFPLAKIAGGPLSVPFSVGKGGATKIEITLSCENVNQLEFESAVVHLAKPNSLEENAVAGRSTPQKGKGPAAAGAQRNPLKILHRVYFGFDGKPDQFSAYLDTWKDQLPDFEIRHWNASNLPMDINPYVRQLHAERDHAFLTDFFRWYLLREYGGVYLDADVEVVNGTVFRNLVDELHASEDSDAFIGIDEKVGGWYTAHSMASKPKSDIANFMCDLYENFGSFAAWRKKGLYFWAPQLVGLYFANRGHHKDGMGTTPMLESPTVVSRVKIYPQDWFSPLAPTGDSAAPFRLNGNSPNTCLCHHFACSWHDESSAYLKHSQAQGGQTGVLLRDIVSQHETRLYFAASERMHTVVGLKSDSGIATQAVAGVLSYGPYDHVASGSYVAHFDFERVINAEGLTVEIVCQSGNSIISRVPLGGHNLSQGRASVAFSVSRDANDVEFRLVVREENAFLFKQVVLEHVHRKADSEVEQASGRGLFGAIMKGIERLKAG